MEKTAIFIITEGSFGLDICCTQYPALSRLNIAPAALYRNMCEIADNLNNFLHIGVEFVVE